MSALLGFPGGANKNTVKRAKSFAPGGSRASGLVDLIETTVVIIIEIATQRS
jgi:hypothetical protein